MLRCAVLGALPGLGNHMLDMMAVFALYPHVACHFAGTSSRKASGNFPDVPAAAVRSSGSHSSDKSADLVMTAECTIDFTSAAWKSMSRQEKNRASAAASRARREAYTQSLEDKVRDFVIENILFASPGIPCMYPW